MIYRKESYHVILIKVLISISRFHETVSSHYSRSKKPNTYIDTYIQIVVLI